MFNRGIRSEMLAARWGLSRGDLWGTPRALFDVLDDEFGFVLDAAAVADDALCNAYIGPAEDALSVSWAARVADLVDATPERCAVFCNPPYSVRGGGHMAWMEKGIAEAAAGLVVVLLVGAGPASHAMRLAHTDATEKRWSARRLACVHPDTGEQLAGNNGDQCVVVCTPAGGPATVSYFDPPPAACGGGAVPVDWSVRRRGSAI